MRHLILLAALGVAACAPVPPRDPGFAAAEASLQANPLPPPAPVIVPGAQLAAARAAHDAAARDFAEAAAYCRFAGVSAGAGNPVFGASVWGEGRTTAACMDYFRTTGRVPGRS
jgi:hypothetical protein